VRRGAERALEETDATMNALQRDTSRLEEENEVMVKQIVGLTKELQEARDSKEEAWLLRRQRVQMFREVSARVMETTRRLGIEGLILPPALEDDGVILRFFCQLSDK
jgi:chromosome segregation ATPase